MQTFLPYAGFADTAQELDKSSAQLMQLSE